MARRDEERNGEMEDGDFGRRDHHQYKRTYHTSTFQVYIIYPSSDIRKNRDDLFVTFVRPSPLLLLLLSFLFNH